MDAPRTIFVVSLWALLLTSLPGSSQDEFDVDGQWSQWSAWQPCLGTSRGPYTKRTRECNNPPPSDGGLFCKGVFSQTRECQPIMDGNWSEWGRWSPCSCEQPTSKRFRTCSNPSPSNGGSTCTGKSMQTNDCAGIVCPVDGNWSEWGEWKRCSCGQSITKRFRSCSNPAPKNGGLACVGESIDRRKCLNKKCRLNGEWSEWSNWDICTCDKKIIQRTRTCSNSPLTQEGGMCIGESKETSECVGLKCPVIGQWSEWGNWKPCVCGKQFAERTRICSNPLPSYGEAMCVGESKEIFACVGMKCPVDGQWSEWGSWDGCTLLRACQSRRRVCDHPAPRNGGMHCPGISNEMRNCPTIRGIYAWWCRST